MTAKNKGNGDLQICDTCVFAVGPDLKVPEKYKDLLYFFVNLTFAHLLMCNNTHSSHYRHVLFKGHGCGMYEPKGE